MFLWRADEGIYSEIRLNTAIVTNSEQETETFDRLFFDKTT